MTTIFGTMDHVAAAAANAAAADHSIALGDASEAPTTIPCGITISITIDC